MGRVMRAYFAARRALPLLYLALAFPSPLPSAAAAVLLALELSALRGFHTAAAGLHVAVAGLLPQPLGFFVVAGLIPLYRRACMFDNVYRWHIHLPPLLVASFFNLQYVPAALYVLGEVVYYGARFALAEARAEVRGRPRAVAGAPFSYVLVVETGVPARVVLPDGRELAAAPRAEAVVKARVDVAGVYSPLIEVVYRSPTGLVEVRRRVRHPPIVVVPRVKAAVEVGARAVEAEEVREVREYAPGDPLRRLHWKKMAKVLRPVVKVLEGRGSGVLKVGAVLYASDAKSLDKALAALAEVLAGALAAGSSAELLLIHRGGVEAVSVSRANYREAVERAVAMAFALGGSPPAYRDLAGLFGPPALPRVDILVGDRVWASKFCKSAAVCRLV